MHLAQRSYILIMLGAVLGIAAIWSSEPGIAALWRLPTAILLLGLALEGWTLRHARVVVSLETSGRSFLGREQAGALVLRSCASQPIAMEIALSGPAGVELLEPTPRILVAGPQAVARYPLRLLPVRLGTHLWPKIPVRLSGPLGLARWSRELDPSTSLSVAPDTLRSVRGRPKGNRAEFASRRAAGAGSELYQLRGYRQGDPPARIDWKATARVGQLVTREFSEDQHLDVLVAVDAGRFARVRAGHLDRFGLFSNISARLAEVVVANDDRIGMVVFADRPLAIAAPERGLAGVMRLRRTLEGLSVQQAESDPLAAAVRIRALLRHRSLVVLLTDADDANVADQLAKAVRLMSPPHLVLVGAVRSAEIAMLARSGPRSWIDPWIALAAQEHESRAHAHRLALRRLGVTLVSCDEGLLEQALLNEYARLRRAHRI